MILVGNQRGGGSDLATHLLKAENDHVTVYEIRGFMSDDLHEAFREIQAVSKATKCKQYLFSLSLNPPQNETVSERAFERAADAAEERLGLREQPRAIVFHEKEGRRHAHVVWSRIDPVAMKAINLSHYKNKLNSLAKDIYLEHGWSLPEGMKDKTLTDPLNFSLAEWQQALRANRDIRELKQVFTKAWERSDSAKALNAALEQSGFKLARGDKRGVVAVDYLGEVYSVARYANVKSKDVLARIGDLNALPSTEDAKEVFRQKITPRLQAISHQQTEKHDALKASMRKRIKELTVLQQDARSALKTAQAARWDKEQKHRQARFRTGMSGVWDFVSGRNALIRKQNAFEAWEALKRDQSERDALVYNQLGERKLLQRLKARMRAHIREDQRRLDRDTGDILRMDRNAIAKTIEVKQQREQMRARYRPRSPSLSR